ncbi:hypothetical protein IPJ91_03190 [bacterium]|nr:MAG: hypothetical protein IPJ91_03190 [bacterium]
MILLVDSHALIHRAFHAYPDTLTIEDGTVINAVYGFTSMLLGAIEKLKPDRVICAFDTKAPTFRAQEYSGYKANRSKTDDILSAQFSLVEEIVAAFDVKIVKLDGFEADDIIGTLSQKLSNNEQVIILTGDNDEYQLVNENVSIFMIGRSFSQSRLLNLSLVKQKLGFDPLLLPDFKALKGDSSDNIPGIAGIGEKTALELIKQFQTIENIYINIDQVESKVSNKLIDQYELAMKFKQITTIQRDVPTNIDIEDIISHNFYEFDLAKVENTFRKFEFRSLLDKARKMKNLPMNQNNKNQKEDLKVLLSVNVEKPILIGDVLVGWDLKKYFKEHLDEYQQFKISNKKSFDLMLATFLINFSTPLSYTEAAEIFIDGHDDLEHLFHTIEEELNKSSNAKLKKLFYDLEMPLVYILLEMELNGICIDIANLSIVEDEIVQKVSELKKDIFALIGHEVNLDSPKQIGDTLALEQGIPLKRKGKSKQFATSAEDLEKYLGVNPIIEKLLEYRTLSKLHSTYIIGLKNSMQIDKKIHTTYNQAQVVTGRLSSNNPNMQNIPKGNELADQIKASFVADMSNPESYLVSFDYSQQEIRLLAYLANEESLIKAFQQGLDIHKVTASKLFHVEYESVSKEQRNTAKTINFGIIYGIGSRALGISLNLNQVEAKGIIDDFFDNYDSIKNYYKNLFEIAKAQGYIETILGRRKKTTMLNSNNKGIVSQVQREVMNFPIQGSGADLTKLAMRDVYAYITANKLEDKVKMLLQIHDELVFEVTLSEKDRQIHIEKMQKIMENVVPEISSIVPLEVDFHVSKSWGK